MVLLWYVSLPRRQFDFAVFHTVTAMITPRPKIQMKRPSATGPSEASAYPPGELFSCVFLRYGGNSEVVEQRHILWAGDHCLIDVSAAGRLEAWCVFTLRQRPTSTGYVVAHRAVDPEKFNPLCSVTATRGE